MVHSFEDTLVRQCALTLAGLKAGSLFCFSHEDLSLIHLSAAQWDARLRPLGISVQVLLERKQTSSALVYVCRPGQLCRLLALRNTRRFLERAGYRWGDCRCLLEQLSLRLRSQDEFPHEIGLFLGYPLRDVIGFIQNRGQNFTCCGLWKSYGNPEAMERCFACCRSCIDAYIRLYEQGTPIEDLAIPA